MSNGNVRRIKSGSFFTSSKTEELTNQRSKKRKQEDEEIPNIFVTESSTASLVEKPLNINLNLLSSTYHKTRHAGCHTFKLNRSKYKQAWYEAHKKSF